MERGKITNNMKLEKKKENRKEITCQQIETSIKNGHPSRNILSIITESR